MISILFFSGISLRWAVLKLSIKHLNNRMEGVRQITNFIRGESRSLSFCFLQGREKVSSYLESLCSTSCFAVTVTIDISDINYVLQMTSPNMIFIYCYPNPSYSVKKGKAIMRKSLLMNKRKQQEIELLEQRFPHLYWFCKESTFQIHEDDFPSNFRKSESNVNYI